MHAPTNRLRDLLPNHELSDLEEWKRELKEATDFGEAYHSFLARFGNHDGFFAASQPTTEPLLTSIVEDLASHVLGRKVAVRHAHLLEIPARRFVHGVLDLGAHSAHVVFFRDDLSGLLALTTGGFSGALLIVRVTGSLVRKPERPDPDV